MKAPRLILLLIVASSFTFPANDVKLEYTFKVGDQYDWSQSAKQSIKQSIPGMGDMTFDVALEGGLLLKVVELTSNGAKIEAQYTRLKMISKSPMGNINMDSESADDNLQTKVTKSIMGKVFYFYMTKKGVVEKVE